MSGRSCGSGSCGGSLRLGSAPTHHELVLDALYERKNDNKSVRVFTVIVYVFCVSLAAIMLSLYYVFFWEPKDAQYAQHKVLQHVTSTTPMPTCFLTHNAAAAGRSNTTINNVIGNNLTSLATADARGIIEDDSTTTLQYRNSSAVRDS